MFGHSTVTVQQALKLMIVIQDRNVGLMFHILSEEYSSSLVFSIVSKGVQLEGGGIGCSSVVRASVAIILLFIIRYMTHQQQGVVKS